MFEKVKFTNMCMICAPCDVGMYQALGFDTHLGNTFAYLR